MNTGINDENRIKLLNSSDESEQIFPNLIQAKWKRKCWKPSQIENKLEKVFELYALVGILCSW